MSPAVVPQYVDGKGYGLQQQAGIQVPVPEQEEQRDGVQVSYPEIVFLIASGKEHAGQAQYTCYQVYQQHRLAGYFK